MGEGINAGHRAHLALPTLQPQLAFSLIGLVLFLIAVDTGPSSKEVFAFAQTLAIVEPKLGHHRQWRCPGVDD